MKKLLGYGYRIVYWIKELLEKIHLLILISEVALLFASARRIVRELDHAHMHDFGDLTLLVVLCIFLLVDLLVRLRRYRRGYRFGGIRALLRPPLRNQQQLLERMRELRARGLRGHLVAADATARRAAAEKIAVASATVFSVKTLGTTDTEWAHAEAEYLNAWLTRFPWAVWWLPLTAAGSSGACCFSVIVPICEDSYQMIRRGHLNTALAHIDAEAAEFAVREHGGVYQKPIRWLAYVQGVTQGEAADTATDLSPLFYCSVEHLAFLLRRFYSDALDATDTAHGSDTAKRWNFSIICEASNGAQRHALGLLGFAPIKYFRVNKESSIQDPVESPSGFLVCELTVPPLAAPNGVRGDLPLQRFIEATTIEAKAGNTEVLAGKSIMPTDATQAQTGERKEPAAKSVPVANDGDKEATNLSPSIDGVKPS